jgi:Ca2+-transporting ATPase
MIYEITLAHLATLAFAATPLSLIAANQINKLFSKHNPQIAKTTVITTDVLGTLTKESIEVKNLYFNNYKASIDEKTQLIEVEDLKSKEKIQVEKIFLRKDESIQLAAITSHLCHYQKLEEIENITNKCFKKCNFRKENVEEAYDILEKLPTNKTKKYSTVVAIKNSNKDIFSFTKGHPLEVLKKCKRILINGKKVELTPTMKNNIRNKVKRLNKSGQKAIGFAYKWLPMKRLAKYSEEFAENDSIFLGIIGLGNQLNEELKPKIEEIKSLGIKMYVLAEAIERKSTAAAIELGITNPTYFEAISGEDLDDLNEHKLEKLLTNKEKDYVFTNLSKDNKKRIIKALENNGEKVTSISKNNNIEFEKIIEDIKSAKENKSNYPKIVFHAISCKISEIIIVLTTFLFNAFSPLTITLILLIDFAINLPLELSLKFDPINKEKKSYISKKRPMANGLFLGAVITGIYLFNLTRYGWTPGNLSFEDPVVLSKSATMSFLLLAISQVINAFSIRTNKTSIFKSNPQKNPYLIAISIICILLTYAAISFSSFSEYLGLSTLSSLEWKLILFATVLIIIAKESKKLTARKLHKK